MNAFVKHHSKSIRFEYSCFDRILLNTVIPVLQQPPSIVWFLRRCLGSDIAEETSLMVAFLVRAGELRTRRCRDVRY